MTWQTMTDEEANSLKRDLFRASVNNPNLDDSTVDRLMEESFQATWNKPKDSTKDIPYGARRATAALSLDDKRQMKVDKQLIENVPEPEVPDVIFGTKALDYAKADPKLRAGVRTHLSHELAETSRGEDALRRNITEWLRTSEWSPLYNPDDIMDPGTAAELAKAEGVDLKFDKPVSVQTATEAINVARRKKELEAMLADNYGSGSTSWANNLAVMGSSLTGYIGPVELASTLLVGALAPQVTVAGIAKGADMLSKVAQAKKVADINRTVTSLKTMQTVLNASRTQKIDNIIMYSKNATNKIVKAAPKAEEISRIGAYSTEEFVAALRGASSKAEVDELIATALKQEQSALKYSDLLEATQALRYDNLSWWAKSGADAMSFPIVDRPFIEAKYSDSNNLGLGYYSERDRMFESLLAAFGGPVLLGGVRFIGNKLGIHPASLVKRTVDDNIRKIDVAEATGKISPEDAKALRDKHVEIKTVLEEKVKNNELKKPNPRLKKAAEEMQAMNIDSDTAVTYTYHTIDALAQGKEIRISEIPGNIELHTSHIDARVLASGMENGFENVLEEGLERVDNATTGLYSIKVTAETGRIGEYTIYGFSKEDAEENLNLLYAGLTGRDEKAYARFKEKSRRFAQFSQNLDELEKLDNEITMHNKRVAKARKKMAEGTPVEEESISFKDQRFYRKSYLTYSYLQYVLPDDVLRENRDLIDALLAENDPGTFGRLLPEGFSKDDMFALYPDTQEKLQQILDALDGADAFTKKWYHKKAGGYGFEQMDAAFGDFAGDMRTAASDFTRLAALDDVIAASGAEQMARTAESLANFDVGPSTTRTLFMGYDKIDFKEFKDVRKTAQVKKEAVAKARMDVAVMMNSEEGSRTFYELERYSVTDSTTGSLFTRATKKLEAIHNLEDTAFEGLDEAIHTAIRGREDFQNLLASIDLNNVTTRDLRAVRSFLRSTLNDVLTKDSRLAAIIPEGDRAVLVNNMVKEFSKASEGNAALIGALMTPENLKAASGKGLRKARSINPEGKTFAEKVKPLSDVAEDMKQAGEYALAWTNFQGLVIDSLKGRLADIELQTTQDLRVAFRNFTQMKEMPEVAAEVLTGGATQTHYAFKGSAQSVEAKVKSAGMYDNNVNQILLSKKATDGTSLYQWAHAPENRDDILENIIRIRRGEAATDNDNAYQVAKVVTDTQGSVMNYYKQFGANYDLSGSTIRRGSLRYADAALTDDEFGNIVETLNQVKEVSPEKIIADAERVSSEFELVKYGKVTASVSDKSMIEAVAKKCNQINEDITAIIGGADRATDKANLYFLRDLDLDAMFNKADNLMIPMNDVRDALLAGDLYSLASKDVYAVNDIAASVRRIRTALKGSLPPKKAAGAAAGELVENVPYSPGFYHNFVQGVYDLSANVSGKKAAALDLLDNQIVFKNVDAEVEATKKFGYENLDDYLHHTFEDMVRGQAVLEEFGTTPGEMARTLIDTYNNMVLDKSSDNLFRNALLQRAIKKVGNDPAKIDQAMQKYVISEGAKDSVVENVSFGCGLQNQAPATASRWFRLIKTFLSASQLVKAGFKSFADYGTMMSGLLMNGMVENAPEAISKLSYVTMKMIQHPELRKMHYAVTLLTADEYMRIMNNDLVHEVEQASKQTDILTKAENASRFYGSTIMNTFGRMEAVTNSNKKCGALAISNSIAEHVSRPFNEWSDNLKNLWMKEGFVAEDVDFIRREFITDASDLIRQFSGKEAKDMESFKLLNVMSGYQKSNDVFRQELIRRGVQNITDADVQYFKDSFLRRMWTMIDRGSDEMVSLPSGRVLNWMHGGKARNSFAGVIMDILTQYQSFGASLLYNNFGKYFANQTIGETGITIIDLFNPAVRLANHSRPKVYMAAAGVLFTIASAMVPVETLAWLSVGQFQKPVDENGIHMDLLGSTLLGSLGTAGLLIDALIGAVEGSGQRGGGFSIQVAPSISNAARTLYRLGKPLTSSRIDDEDRPEAVGAAAFQELMRYIGVSSLPFVALAYQYFMGARLNVSASGGMKNYRTKLRQRERRGYVTMPWEKYPEFGGSWEW